MQSTNRCFHGPSSRWMRLAGACLACAAATAMAERPEADSWRLQADAGFVSQFEGSIDNGGEFDADRYFLRFGISRRLNADWTGGISVGYGETRYGFSGQSGFGGLDPWEDIRQFRVSAPLRYRADENWTLIGIPTLRYYEESGAEGSSSQLGLLAAGAYRFSDSLTIGPGFGVFSGLEEDTDFFPILLIDWKISDTWRLETGRGLGATRGPGVSLKWQPMPDWTFSLGARYEKTRFRLDETGPAPDGVGEDRSVPVSLAASYSPNKNVELTLLGGVEFAGTLRLEDRDGNFLAESDYDTAPFAGLLLNLKF